MEGVFGVLVLAGFFYLVVRRIRKVWNMTPVARKAARADRRLRHVERDLQRHKTYGD